MLLACRCAASRPSFAAKLETKRTEVERALEYVELYGLYTECEAVYQVDRLIALWDELSAEDQAAFNFDPRSVDWVHYITQIHLPSIIQHARVKTGPGKTTIDRTARLRRQVLSPDRHVVAFDLENTLIASNVVESYSWLATRRLDTPERVRYVLNTLREAPDAAQARSHRPGRLPAPLLPPVRACARRADRRGRPRTADPDHPDQELPGRVATSARTPSARPSHDPDHRCAQLCGRGVAALVRRDRGGRDVGPS